MKVRARDVKTAVIINARRPGALSQFSVLDPMPPEGPLIIAAVLRRMGLMVNVIDESITPLTSKNVLWSLIADADLVGISAMTCTENRGSEILRKAQELNPRCVCVAGGMGPSSNPEHALANGADFVVIGEGEQTIQELVLLLQNGGDLNNVNGLAWLEGDEIKYSQKRPFIVDLDQVPFADWSLLIGSYKARIRTITLSRGCPHGCTFCSVTQTYGATYRHRSVVNAIEYVEHAYRGHRPLFPLLGMKSFSIFLGDDNIAAKTDWAKKFFRGIAEANLFRLALSVQMRASACRDSELMDLAQKAGVKRIFFGYEDPNLDGLLAINKKQTPEDIDQSIIACHKRGIAIGGMFIFGLDTQTVQSGVETAKFALRKRIDAFFLYVRVPLPKTKDTAKLASENRLLANVPTDKGDGLYVMFKPFNMSAQALQKAHLKAIKTFYNPIRAIVDWLTHKINKANLFYRLAGSYYVSKMKKAANRFTKEYLKDI